jgi:hypothetical protein
MLGTPDLPGTEDWKVDGVIGHLLASSEQGTNIQTSSLGRFWRVLARRLGILCQPLECSVRTILSDPYTAGACRYLNDDD